MVLTLKKGFSRLLECFSSWFSPLSASFSIVSGLVAVWCLGFSERFADEPGREVLLSLGCVNNALSSVSPVIVTSNGALNIGGVATRVDLRIGFWGKHSGVVDWRATVMANQRARL